MIFYKSLSLSPFSSWSSLSSLPPPPPPQLSLSSSLSLLLLLPSAFWPVVLVGVAVVVVVVAVFVVVVAAAAAIVDAVFFRRRFLCRRCCRCPRRLQPDSGGGKHPIPAPCRTGGSGDGGVLGLGMGVSWGWGAENPAPKALGITTSISFPHLIDECNTMIKWRYVLWGWKTDFFPESWGQTQLKKMETNQKVQIPRRRLWRQVAAARPQHTPTPARPNTPGGGGPLPKYWALQSPDNLKLLMLAPECTTERAVAQ